VNRRPAPKQARLMADRGMAAVEFGVALAAFVALCLLALVR
jgi:Flp pilus assembly pilin Flp